MSAEDGCHHPHLHAESCPGCAPTARQALDHRVRRQLVRDGIRSGLTPVQAVAWAEGRMTSLQAAGIRLELAVDDLSEALRASAVGRLLERMVGWLDRRLR